MRRGSHGSARLDVVQIADVEMTLYMMYLDQRVGPHWFDPFDPFDPLRGSGHMSVK